MPCKYHYFNILNLTEQINDKNNENFNYRLHRQLYHELQELPEKCKTTPYFQTEIKKKTSFSSVDLNVIGIDREKDAIIKNCKMELSWKERLENWCNRKHYYLEK